MESPENKTTPAQNSEDENPYASDARFHQCPSCGCRDTRRSLPRGMFDAILNMFDYVPYRCRRCYRRFVRKLPKKEEEIVVAEPAEAVVEPTEEVKPPEAKELNG